MSINRRKILAGAVGLGATSIAGGMAFAQISGPGKENFDTDPRVLPGPWGFVGGPHGPKGQREQEKDGSKEIISDAGEILQDIGGLEITGGSAIMGGGGTIVSISGETGFGLLIGVGAVGFGFGITMGGVLSTGVGMVAERIAEDPPRPNYKQSPGCGFSSLRRMAGYQNSDPVAKAALDATTALFASAGNTLASLELWQGATQANDAEWQKFHRKGFVSGWNKMRSDFGDYANKTDDVLAAFDTLMASNGVTMSDLNEFLKANSNAVADEISNNFAEAKKLVSDGCNSEFWAMKEAEKRFSAPTQLADISSVRKQLKSLKALALKLPVYQ